MEDPDALEAGPDKVTHEDDAQALSQEFSGTSASVGSI